MANIMLIDSCNLNCPYCFANEFVNKDKNAITEENFDAAVKFILTNKNENRIGLIGGEPTLHPKFEKFLKKLIKNNQIETIMVYTNGILLDKYADIIGHKKIHMLINCNSPRDIGEKNFNKLISNLDYLLNKKMLHDQITLGINMYKPDFEYTYLVDLLKKYGFHRVRISISVPNEDNERNRDSHEYFNEMKPQMFRFFHELLKNDIIPNFDCNKIPSCLITDEEFEQFNVYFEQEYIKENIDKSNISRNEVICHPVIDIRQDLTAVRCFGLSEYTKEKISDFKSIEDLANYYFLKIDSQIFNTIGNVKCKDCHDRKTLKCCGGCLAFKIKDILKISQYIDSELERKVPKYKREK